MYLDNTKDTLEEETVSDDLFVSNFAKATPPIYVVFVQDKEIAVNAYVHPENKQVLTYTWSSHCSHLLEHQRCPQHKLPQ